MTTPYDPKNYDKRTFRLWHLRIRKALRPSEADLVWIDGNWYTRAPAGHRHPDQAYYLFRIGDSKIVHVSELPEPATQELARTRAHTHLQDDPEVDGTDAAHPAWWRGNDAGVEGATRRLTDVLDGGPLPGHLGYQPLQRALERVSEMKQHGNR